MATSRLTELIRSIPDFPVAGILYRDITPLLASGEAFTAAVTRMTDPWRGERIDLVAAMEARGFLFGAGVALQLGCGLVPVRKAGKLPHTTVSVTYELEYRTDTLHMHTDGVMAAQRVLVVDDVLATGGTAAAVVQLLRGQAAEVIGCQFLLELHGLGARDRLDGVRLETLLTLPG